MAALRAAAERVLTAEGKVLAFVESDRILLTSREVRRLLPGVLNRTERPK